MRLVVNDTDPKRRALLEKDGPFRKFYLLKQFGAQLIAAGFDPKTMSCAELSRAIVKIAKTEDRS